MADDPSFLAEEQPTLNTDQAPGDIQAPMLQAVQGLFQTDEGQQWGRDAATRIQDYLNVRSIAQANNAMGQQFQQNVTSFQNQLGEMARGEPQSTNLALDLVPSTVRGLVENHPHLPEDQLQSIHDDLVQQIQGHIAREGVMGAGDIHEGFARNLLNSDRIQALLTPEENKSLDGYITGMQMARTIDANAMQTKKAQQMQDARDNQTLGYMGALAEPGTYDLNLQPGWAQRVMKDPLLPPEYTAPMLYLYNRLATNGDAAETDPVMAEQLIRGVAQGNVSMTDVLGHAGGSLKLADALTIGGMLRPQNEAQKGEASSMIANLDAARRDIVGQDGENGAAGERAYQRFVQWMLPQYRMAGPGSLNPNNENWLFAGEHSEGYGGAINAFKPNGDELLGNPIPLYGGPQQKSDRISLGQIFGGPEYNAAKMQNQTGDIYIPPKHPIFRQPSREVQQDNLGEPGNSMENNNPERNI